MDTTPDVLPAGKDQQPEICKIGLQGYNQAKEQLHQIPILLNGIQTPGNLRLFLMPPFTSTLTEK